MSFTYVTSRYGVATDALVGLLQASPALAAPVVVSDGPYAFNSQTAGDFVCVGWDGNYDPATARFMSSQFHQDQAYVGGSAKNEQIELQCAVLHFQGDMVVKTARDAALTLLAAVEDVLRANPGLGIDGATGPAVISQGSWWQQPGDRGIQVRCVFTVHIPTFLISSPY